MIFLGDIAIPRGVEPEGFSPPSGLFTGPVVANLEGPLVTPSQYVRPRSLYNDLAVLPFLQRLGIRAVSLANNHIMDEPLAFAGSQRLLTEGGILSFGAGRDLEEAGQPVLLRDGHVDVVLLGFGWEPIGCKAATRSGPGTNPLRRSRLLESVRAARRTWPSAKLVVYLHWNYEMELYPQPGHRQLAFQAIDEGASLVVGCHSHCVQHLESYRGALIAYGLGNWAIPHGTFWKGQLRYPEPSLLQMALEWSPGQGTIQVHSFRYEPRGQRLEYLGTEDDRAYIAPFANMRFDQYHAWFRRNRRKKFFLPIYPADSFAVGDAARNGWVDLRNFALGGLAAAGIKRGPR